MRRFVGLVLLLATLAMASPALAQPSAFTVLGPGGTLLYSNASVTAANSAGAVSLFQYVVPAAYVATQSTVGAVASQYYDARTSTGMNTPVLFGAPAPLHLRAMGLLAGAAGTGLSIGVNFGAASVNLNNNIGGTISGPGNPVRLDVYLIPIASSSATPTSSNMVTQLVARLVYVSATNATETTVSSSQVTAVNLASPNTLNVIAQWSAAASSSSLTFFSRILRIIE